MGTAVGKGFCTATCFAGTKPAEEYTVKHLESICNFNNPLRKSIAKILLGGIETGNPLADTTVGRGFVTTTFLDVPLS